MSNGEKGKEEEVMSETTERSFEANMKIQVGNEIAHAKRIDVLSELSIKQAIEFQQKANDAYLEKAQKQSDETLNFATQLHHQVVENNRYTLDRLYSVFPEEAVGIGTLLRAFQEYLKQAGWTPPTTS